MAVLPPCFNRDTERNESTYVYATLNNSNNIARLNNSPQDKPLRYSTVLSVNDTVRSCTNKVTQDSDSFVIVNIIVVITFKNVLNYTSLSSAPEFKPEQEQKRHQKQRLGTSAQRQRSCESCQTRGFAVQGHTDAD